MAGINTIVFGVLTTQFNLPASTLQAYANAGAGEATIAPVGAGQDVNAFYDQCSSGNPGWVADLTASGKPKARGTSLGTYATTMGPTKPYQPNAADQTQLDDAALGGAGRREELFVRPGRRRRQVDQGRRHQALVGCGQDSGDGDPAGRHQRVERHTAAAPSTLVLSGNACKTWQTPNTNDISFAFPCSTIIFE